MIRTAGREYLEVIARLMPAAPGSRLKVADLNAFLAALPKLAEDADAFLEDVRTIRRDLPAETDPWH